MDESVEAGPSVLDNPVDIEQIRLKPENRWLSRPQICQILQNHKKFHITSARNDKPPSGSLFLFNKTEQTNFRNDGYIWTKKKDGKALLEGHRKYKVQSFGDLHCYYAHREDNRNFQRRFYWMHEGDFSHIVVVHYLQVTGKTEDFSCVKETQRAGPHSQETNDIMPNSDSDGSMHSNSHPNNCQVTEITDTMWPNCAQVSEHESAQSVDIGYNHQPSSGLHSGLEVQQPAAENIGAGGSDTYGPLFSPTIPCIDLPPTQPDKGKSDNDAELAHDPWRNIDSESWKDIFDRSSESPEDQSLFSPSCPGIMGKFSSNSIVERQDFGVHSQIQKESEALVEDSSSLSKQPMDQKLHSDSACDTTSKFHKEVSHLELMSSIDPQLKHPDIRNDNSMENCFQALLSNEEHESALPPDSDACFNSEGKSIYSSVIEHLFDGILTEEGSKKRSSSGANGETDGFNESLSTIPGINLHPTQLDMGKSDNDVELTHHLWTPPDVTLLEDDCEGFTCNESTEYGSFSSSSRPDSVGRFVSNDVVKRLDFVGHLKIQEKSKASFEDSSSLSKWPMDQNLYSESACDTTSKSMKYGEHDHVLPPDSDDNLNLEGKSIYPSAFKQHLFDSSLMEEDLKTLDSFMRKELGDVTDVNESHKLPDSGALWGTVENENGIEIGVSRIPSEGQVQTFMPGPSMSQDQLFGIIDFSPNWAYVGSETKVLIVGRFMKRPDVLENCKWSCMFGEVAVPAEVIADGVLCCHTPTHEARRIPFYIMSSNGLVCSEVREFEFRTVPIEDINTAENYNSSANDNLELRFDKLLTLSSKLTISDTSSQGDISQLSSKVSPLQKGDYKESDQMLKTGSGMEFSFEKLKDQLLQKHLKEKLHAWIFQKVPEGGKGPCVLDEGGQGVLHFAAALGYDWAFEPTIVAGVGVNFCDVNGWTALHWAAFCGREHTVASLISLGAATSALTHTSPKYPFGRTPADLASVNGHKGIAGYLEDRSLNVHIPPINLDHRNNAAGPKAVPKISEISAAPLSLGNASDGQSQKDSLATRCDNDAESRDLCQIYLNLESWKGDFESCHPCSESMEDQSLSSSSHPDTGDKLSTDSFVGLNLKEHSQIHAESKHVHPDTRNDNFVDSGANSEKVENENENDVFGIHFDNGPKAVQNISGGLQAGKGMNDDDFGLPYESQEFGGQPEMQEECQMHPNVWIDNSMENGCQTQLSNSAYDYVLPNDSDGYLNMKGKSIYPSATRQHLRDGSLTEEGLKKLDNSIPRMSEMSEEIGDVTDLDESRMQYCAGVNWETVQNGNGNGNAGYLADLSSDVHIPSVNLDHHDDAAVPEAVQKISEISAAPPSLRNASDGQSQKDSLAPTCDAATAQTVLKKIVLKIVLKLDLHCEKRKCKAMKLVCQFSGVQSVTVDMEKGQMQVIGAGIDAAVFAMTLYKKVGSAELVSIGLATRNEDKDDEEGLDNDNDKGPDKDEGPDKEKQEGKKRAPDPALEGERANKISKAHLAFMALLTAYYNVQSTETIQMLVLVFVGALKKIGERKLSHINDGFQLSAIRV